MIPENKAKIVSVIKRYRDETPLGHQPHMLAHLADEALAIMDAEQAIPANCGSGHCSCVECFKEDAQDYQAKCAELELVHDALDVAERDAARWGWFAGIVTGGDFERAEKAFACFERAESCTKEELDAAVDAAMEQSK